MSVLKFTNAKVRRTDALKKSIDYILDASKTSNTFIFGNGLNVNSAYNDMNTTQLLLRKNTGRRYIHYVLSFDLGVNPEKAYCVAKECAKYFSASYQYVLAIHTNTANVHAHIIMNAVNICTGKKFSQSSYDLLKFRDYVNERLIESGLNPISVNTSNKLVSEEVCENIEFEFDCNSTIPKEPVCNHSFSEAKYLKAYGYNFSYFGPIDEDEAQQIGIAESIETPLSQIIRFFQGLSLSLPFGMDVIEAEGIYVNWCESQKQAEEDVEYGFFAKNSRRNDR